MNCALGCDVWSQREPIIRSTLVSIIGEDVCREGDLTLPSGACLAGGAAIFVASTGMRGASAIGNNVSLLVVDGDILGDVLLLA